MTFFFWKLGSCGKFPGHKLRRICGFILWGSWGFFFLRRHKVWGMIKHVHTVSSWWCQVLLALHSRQSADLGAKIEWRCMCCICFRPICLPILGWTLELWFCPSSMPVVLSFRLSFFAKTGRCKRVTRDSHVYDMIDDCVICSSGCLQPVLGVPPLR